MFRSLILCFFAFFLGVVAGCRPSADEGAAESRLDPTPDINPMDLTAQSATSSTEQSLIISRQAAQAIETSDDSLDRISSPVKRMGAETEESEIELVEAKHGLLGFKRFEYKSPFSKETVLKLNAIVQRSKDAIDELDALQKTIRREGLPDEDQLLNQTKALSKQAADARKDMRRAVNELNSSGEDYSSETLAGMVKFVRQVDNEIRKELQKLQPLNDPGNE